MQTQVLLLAETTRQIRSSTETENPKPIVQGGEGARTVTPWPIGDVVTRAKIRGFAGAGHHSDSDADHVGGNSPGMTGAPGVSDVSRRPRRKLEHVHLRGIDGGKSIGMANDGDGAAFDGV